MSILLTGGTGKTGLPLARLLSKNTNFTTLLASRKGTVPNTPGLELQPSDKLHGVTFDWFDRETWANPFTYTNAHNLPAIDRVFLVGPQTWDISFMNVFIEFAREGGVKRFVLLSATSAESGGPATGQVCAYLEKLAGEVDFTILRPTWFTENFGEGFLQMIRDDNVIYSVRKDGKVPYVSTEDIAAAAFKGLIDEPSPNTDWIIHGPELFTCDEVAAILSTILGRTITHVRITKEYYLKFWDGLGNPELGRGLIEGELKIAEGSEEAIFGKEGAVLGKVTLREYFQKNRSLWIKG